MADTGWTPGQILHVAGAFRFTEYDFFKGWVMRLIAKEKKVEVDPHRDLELTDWPALVLILFFSVLPTFTFLLQPLMSRLSRRHEFQADAYAARQSQAGELINALVKLYEDNASTLTPDPVHSAFYDSHPPAGQRIARLADLSGSIAAPVAFTAQAMP